MDIFALAKQFGQAAGFQDPAEFDFDHCPHEVYSSEPIPDFWERLPDEIIDPNTNEVIYITQSRIKSLRKIAQEQLCPKRYYLTDITKEYQEKTGPAMAMGLRFEFELTGAMMRNGKEPPQILTKTGNPSSDQNRISYNANQGKETLERLGIKTEPENIQQSITRKCLQANVDQIQENPEGRKVTDFKYSGLLSEQTKWNELSFETTSDKFPTRISHKVQGHHYSLVCDADFQFLVFDSRKDHEGEYQLIEIQASHESMNQHKHLILNTIEQLQNHLEGKPFTAVPSYEKCRGCPVLDCKSREKYPETKVIQY